jgi:transcriptional regulator with XRE-family HTH domain
VRSHRKRLGLSQSELAFLLGCASSAGISRYERFARTPTLKTALWFELVLQVPSRELFAGTFESVRNVTRKRALTLARRIERRCAPGPARDRKLKAIQAILESIDSQ